MVPLHEILHRPAPPADARYDYGDAPWQYGELRVPAGTGPHPVVAVLHGGRWQKEWDLAHMGHLCAALTACGIATWNVEYRRLGFEDGGWPGTFHDVALGVDAVAVFAGEHNLDLGHYVVLGHSSGGHLAQWAAARHRLPEKSELAVQSPLPIHAVISMAGIADLRYASEAGWREGVIEELLGGTLQDHPERYAEGSPVGCLPIGIETTLIHGVEDRNVPFGYSERYVDIATAAGDSVHLVAIPEAAHFEIIDPTDRVFPTVLGAIFNVVRRAI